MLLLYGFSYYPPIHWENMLLIPNKISTPHSLICSMNCAMVFIFDVVTVRPRIGLGLNIVCVFLEISNQPSPSQVAEWGMMSMCDAERRLLANALLDISNEWFILLSESCIPLQNFSIVYLYIARSRYSFMGAVDEPGPYGRGRYDGNMAPEINMSDWRKGSQWFEINRELALRIVEDNTYYPKLKEFCKPHKCYVDEHYFQTMLTINTPHLLANRSLTYVDWSRGGAHPATFGKDDIKEEFFKKILQDQTCLYNNQPSSLCFLFARKFAPNALGPLLDIAPKALGIGKRHSF